MINRAHGGAFVLIFFACTAIAQRIPPVPRDEGSFLKLGLWMENAEAQKRRDELGNPFDSVSKLDLKAPASARREYDKGLQLLIRENFSSAVEHLARSLSIYPAFVAAHNALGSAYLDLGRNDHARGEFLQAVLLDDHLPRSHLNLGRAELALKHYSAAEASVKKASSIEPLDLHLLTTLTYVQFLNHDYGAAITTAHQVHGRKHEGAAIVHYFAAAAWQGQNNLQETQHELQTLLEEDPNSPAAGPARQMIAQIEEQETQPPASTLTISYGPGSDDVLAAGEELAGRNQRILQEFREQKQVAEMECETCETVRSPSPGKPDVLGGAISGGHGFGPIYTGWTLRSTVDEVAVFFAATDRGKSITNLNEGDIRIRDDGRAPAAITGFRNESRLPLRVGLLIDTSTSITSRFSFEQGAASDFLQNVLVDKNDLGFVVGFANSILLVQDFTDDTKQISHGVDQLAPAGGTAIWDAVVFAADKLSRRPESYPVAKILVVISDGDDNSSSATLKEAIESAERGEVIAYTVSTTEANARDDPASAGNRALKALAERTGGAAFCTGSRGDLKRSLTELQEAIRSRYLVSYKPALFKQDDQYRTIDITAQQSGRKLRVYARKGYYAK